MRKNLLLNKILNKISYNDRSVLHAFIFCINLLPLEQFHRRYFRFIIRHSCAFK